MIAHPIGGRLELPTNIQREGVSGFGDVETHVCAFIIDASASKAGKADVDAEGTFEVLCPVGSSSSGSGAIPPFGHVPSRTQPA